MHFASEIWTCSRSWHRKNKSDNTLHYRTKIWENSPAQNASCTVWHSQILSLRKKRERRLHVITPTAPCMTGTYKRATQRAPCRSPSIVTKAEVSRVWVRQGVKLSATRHPTCSPSAGDECSIVWFHLQSVSRSKGSELSKRFTLLLFLKCLKKSSTWTKTLSQVFRATLFQRALFVNCRAG